MHFKSLLNKQNVYFSILATSLSLTANAETQAYQWNNTAAIKTPAAAVDNGKRVLFDVSHGGVEGNADWVIDGGFSDFADTLVNNGYTVEEYRGVDLNNDGVIRYHDDYNNPANSSINEAVITYAAIQHADVLVLAETNRPFKTSEYQALEQFVAAGKGIFFIADHYDADRNLNTWDATEVFNGYNRSNLSKYNMGGEYGDLRNPGIANQGWLVENFGLRFRFNGINLIAGVSDIAAPEDSENITAAVEPILMAAGATLAIVDASKAKGLVYFSASDKPTPWSHADDGGLYFGGHAEGPYVAIAKSGAGKAAFIGDSSPIEDNSPKYKRQDSGSSKKTYPGWTDPGHAAVLSVNIINWLATPESYSHFDGANGHNAGIATPTPMAVVETNDPANGQPWGTIPAGFNAWNTDSYANNSYNAPFATSANNGGGGAGNPLNAVHVSEALNAVSGTDLQVMGIVTEAVNGIYGLRLADINDASSINVKLEAAFMDEFNPVLNANIIGQTLLISGTRDSYMSAPGMRNVHAIAYVAKALSVEDVLSMDEGEAVTVEGIISAALNGIYALVLTDFNNSSVSVNIKLESSFRDEFSPELNPALIGQRLLAVGVRDSYMSAPGVRQVSELSLVDGASPQAPPSEPLDCQHCITVSDALATSSGTTIQVTGVVTAAVNGIYALELTDSSHANQAILVKLEAGMRDLFSPQLNPAMLGSTIVVTGKRDSYMSQAGIRHVSDIKLY